MEYNETQILGCSLRKLTVQISKEMDHFKNGRDKTQTSSACSN